MTVKYFLLVNKQGQTRLARYAVPLPPLAERVALEGEIVRKALSRSDKQVRAWVSVSFGRCAAACVRRPAWT
jgi:hypothetical protein